MDMGPDVPAEENKARVLVEKKTVLNLVDAFAVAVKHYLRGESGMMCTQRIFTGFNFTSSQTSITRICITRLNISHHTHCPRVFRPLATLQVICLLRSPSRSNRISSRLSNATLSVTVARDPSLLAAIRVKS